MKSIVSKYKIAALFILLVVVKFSTAQEKKYSFEEEFDKQTWEKAKKIAKQIAIIDCHSHDLFKPKNPIWPKQVTFSMLSENNVDCIVQNVPFDPRDNKNPSERIFADIIKIKDIIKSDTAKVSLALASNDIKKGKNTRIVLGLEYNFGLFNGSIDILSKYQKEGIRQITLSNGGMDTIYVKKGEVFQLTPFGIALISEMNRLGIICDVTHMPNEVRNLVIETSKSPVIISHANAQGVVKDAFNVSDLTLEKLKVKGGLIGLTFFSESVSNECLNQRGKFQNPKDMPRAKVEEFVDHIDYLKKKEGIDYLSIGSDYGGSGRMAPKGLETIEGFSLIIYYLVERGYTKKEIEKIFKLNYILFFERVEKHSNELVNS
ncbi:MAG: hypothetical protein EHM93_02010 [Bacteroidales bacterium]|nr:MAG: hypothetical protein EHM93_02010 [Bacteroidales bacterium]